MIGVIQKQISQAAKQIRQAFMGVVAIGGQNLQVKGLSNEVLQDVENIQQVGFASWIPDECRVVVLPLNGRTGRAVCVATTGGNVIVTVAEGETCIYDQHGHKILLSASGITMTGNVTVEGDFNATGSVSDNKGSMQAMRVTYNGHGGHSSGLAQPKME